LDTGKEFCLQPNLAHTRLCHSSSSSSVPLAHRARRPRHVHVERARVFIKNVERARDIIKNKGTVECHGKRVQQTLVYWACCSDSTTPHSGPHQASSSSSHMPLLPSVSLSLSLSLSLSQTPLLPSGPLQHRNVTVHLTASQQGTVLLPWESLKPGPSLVAGSAV